ncbi:MAG TPA: YkvA family protein [Devosia sp.]|nr:YkvA family protein [Devosia sp.]
MFHAWLDRAKQWAGVIKRDVIAIWLAARDPRTPMAARILAACVAAYALSPIDLIPDFVPVLGYLDDLLIVPLGIIAVVKLIPAPLMIEYRATATLIAKKPVSRAGLMIIVILWLLALLAITILATDLL